MKIRTTAIRIGSCELVSSEPSNVSQPAPIQRIAKTAARTATAMKSIRIRPLVSGVSVEKKKVISRIGPNSPTAPAASR